MKFTRSMLLISNDPESVRRGALKIYERFQDEINKLGLADEVSLTNIVHICDVCSLRQKACPR